MCDPVTLSYAALGIMAAGTVYSHNEQAKQYERQAANIQRASDLEALDLMRQSGQQREATAQDMNEAARRAREDAALFEVQAGEYGSGLSQARGLSVMGIQQSEQMATIARNEGIAQGEIGFRSIQSRELARQRLDSLSRPSRTGTLLTIGAQAVGTQTTVRRYQDQQDATKKASPK